MPYSQLSRETKITSSKKNKQSSRSNNLMLKDKIKKKNNFKKRPKNILVKVFISHSNTMHPQYSCQIIQKYFFRLLFDSLI